ncbi:unnamed protein product [Discosporangium mesarthrocarpum]
MLVKILLLYFCVSYSFAVVGMGLFGDAKSDTLDPRYSFSTLPDALLSLFFLTVSNNWNDLLYPLIVAARWGRSTSIYFVLYMLFCSTIILDILVGVVIEGLRVSQSETRLASPSQAPRTPPFPPFGSEVSNSDYSSNGQAQRGTAPASPSVDHWRGARVSPSPAKYGGLGSRSTGLKWSGYRHVVAEDMFRSGLKEGITEEEAVELEDAVTAIEQRLMDEWLERQRCLPERNGTRL